MLSEDRHNLTSHQMAKALLQVRVHLDKAYEEVETLVNSSQYRAHNGCTASVMAWDVRNGIRTLREKIRTTIRSAANSWAADCNCSKCDAAAAAKRRAVARKAALTRKLNREAAAKQVAAARTMVVNKEAKKSTITVKVVHKKVGAAGGTRTRA